MLANQQVITEYQSTGTQQPTLASRTAYGTYIDEPLILLSALTSQTAYYHANRQYSIYNLTDATGTVLDRIAYTPYGEQYCFTPAGAPRSRLSEAGNTTLYTGRSADTEAGLHYFRARQYFAPIGLFTSRDPKLYPNGYGTYCGHFASGSLDPTGTIKIHLDELVKPDCMTKGTAFAVWQYELDREYEFDGWIVQKISESCQYNECGASCPIKFSIRPRKLYFEAMFVPKGSRKPIARDQAWVNNITDGCGQVIQFGEARFFRADDGTKPRPNGTAIGLREDEEYNDFIWTKNLVVPNDCGTSTSGGFPAQENQPSFWNQSIEKTANRYFSLNWNCCCSDHVSLYVSPNK